MMPSCHFPLRCSFRSALLLLFTLVLIFVAGLTISKAAMPKGIYIIEGREFIQFSNAGNGAVTKTSINGILDYRAVRQGRTLVLQGRRNESFGPLQDLTAKAKETWVPVYEMVKSKKIAGDWDLIRAYEPTDLLRALNGEKDDRMFSAEQTGPLKDPVVSFMHRLDDPAVVAYFAALKTLDYASPRPTFDQVMGNLSKASADLAAAHPNDPFIGIFRLDLLSKEHKTIEDLEKEVAIQKLQMEPLPVLHRPLHSTEELLRCIKVGKTHANAFSCVNKVEFSLNEDKSDLTARTMKLCDMMNYDSYARPVPALVSEMSTLPEQIIAQTARVVSELLLLQGRQEEAVHLLASLYHLGQLMNQNGSSGNRTVGISLRSVASEGLLMAGLNSCETADDSQLFWKTLDFLNQRESNEPSSEEIFAFEHCAPAMPDIVRERTYDELVKRHRAANAKFQLLRMAVAARDLYLRTKAFPSAAADFTFLSKEGLPKDAFKPTAPLGFAQTPEQFICYSVGPDVTDDHGAIEYDPTNGTTSRGDIVVEIPRERTFAFPRQGVKAKSREDLLRQFPNGLPRDPYSINKGSLGVADARPVCIYSVGPQQGFNNRKAIMEGTYIPKIQYDPTNGTMSAGEIMMTVPEP